MPCFSQKHGEMTATPSPLFKIEQRKHNFILKDFSETSVLLSGTVSFDHRAFDGVITFFKKL